MIPVFASVQQKKQHTTVQGNDDKKHNALSRLKMIWLQARKSWKPAFHINGEINITRRWVFQMRALYFSILFILLNMTVLSHICIYTANY